MPRATAVFAEQRDLGLLSPTLPWRHSFHVPWKTKLFQKLLELCLPVVGHKVLAVPAVQWVSVSAMVHWGCTGVWCD